MPGIEQARDGLAAALEARYGRGGDTPPLPSQVTFDAMVRVVLEEFLDARQAALAWEALVEAGLDEAGPIAEADPLELASVWQLAGLKPPARMGGVVRKLAMWLVDRHRGDPTALAEVGVDRLREELRQIQGVGPALTERLLLWGLGREGVPLDRSGYRILLRHGWIDPTADTDELRSTMVQLAQGGRWDDPAGDPRAALAAMGRWSGWMERVGREFCKPTAPRCDRCPLREALPETGPVEWDA